MLNLNSASNLQLFAWTAWVSNVALPSSPWVIHSDVQLTRLNCLLWLSIRLFLLSQVLPFISIIHSSPLTCLSLSLENNITPHCNHCNHCRNNMALAETSSFYTTLRLLYAGWSSNAYQPNICMWLPVTPFVNPSFSFWAYGLICGWPRPVSSRSAKQPGWRSPPIVTIATIYFVVKVIIMRFYLVVPDKTISNECNIQSELDLACPYFLRVTLCRSLCLDDENWSL
jgi:hypothetical protein